MQHKTIVWASILLLLTLAACGPASLGPTPTFPAGAEATTPAAGPTTGPLPTLNIITQEFASPTPPAGTAGGTPRPPTLAPTATALSGTRLQMATGATEVSITGKVIAGSPQTYLVAAQAGQLLMATVDSANEGVSLTIRAADGSLLAGPVADHTGWQGTVPTSGDTALIVTCATGSADFSLGVTIPVRVSFAPGASSASAQGPIGPNGVVTYVLRAQAGQTLSVSVISPGKDVFLTIYGLEDGQPYVRDASGSTSYSFKLPSTQDYVIKLVSGAQEAQTYNVQFSVQ